jgi:ribosomal-protein-alanine N-acetyltransferase
LELRGPTLSLRFPVPEDAPALFRLASDPEVGSWFSWGPYRDPEEPDRWIASLPELRESGTALDFVVRRGDEPIGVIGLNERSVRDRRAMVGTWLGRAHWGTGANAEAKALLCRLGFRTCGLERIGAYADVRNGRSLAALQALGWRHEGTLRRWHRHGDTALDVHILGLLRDEWESSALADVRMTMVRSPPPAWCS